MIKIKEIKINKNRRKVDDKKIKELSESIKELGLLNPITINTDKTLIAGMHRLEACKLLGYDEIKVNIVNLDSLLSELAEIDENLIRNELDWIDGDKQLARRKYIYEELHPETKHGISGAISKHNSANDIMSSAKTFTENTADKVGVTARTVQRSIKRSNDIVEDLKPKLKELDVSKTEGTLISRQEPEVQKKIVKLLEKKKISVTDAIKEIKKEEKKEKKQIERDRLNEIGKNKKIEIDFRLGDFEEVFKDVPDGSIDCIITDPPYPKEFIEVWSKLSRFAKRVLKPNGYCVAYSGQMYLPEVINRMSENLDYYWTFAVYHEGQTQIVNGINLMCRWKPVLIFQNGKKKIENTFQDYFISEKREKNGHDWQQSKSGVAYLIEMFTKKGDTILEPFAGAGTTMIVALEKGRNVIGAEIDEETYNIAKALL
jgi:ParB/RepB/Spo0J family partition protein